MTMMFLQCIITIAIIFKKGRLGTLMFLVQCSGGLNGVKVPMSFTTALEQ